MVQQIFETAAKIKVAETADEAFQIAALFLSTTDAKNIDYADAKKFLTGIKEVFDGHKAPNQLELLLRTTQTLHNSSKSLKELAREMLIRIQQRALEPDQ